LSLVIVGNAIFFFGVPIAFLGTPATFGEVLAGLLITVGSIVVVFQRKYSAVRFAVLLGWFGPLPGMWFDVARQISFPHGDIATIIMTLGEYLLGFLAMYPSVPMFGPYCFIVGLLGWWPIMRAGGRPMAIYLRKSSREPLLTIQMAKWAQPAAIIVVGTIAAVPLALLQFSREVISASIFWIACFLFFRKRIFRTNGEPRPTR
jgi:hypothetical protein